MLEYYELESAKGMLLDVGGLDNFRIRGNIVSVCADTKRAHEMGGSRVLLQKNVPTFVQLNDLTLIL
jgi:hypothetical protein